MPDKQVIYRIDIVDDELHGRDVIKGYLQKIPDLDFTIREANNGLDAVELILQESPDILFLDIQMPELNGFEVLEHIKGDVTMPAVIFTTAYDNFAIKAFEINAADYLLKPFDFARFEIALNRTIDLLKSKQLHDKNLDKLFEYITRNSHYESVGSRILIKENKKAFFVKTTDIVFIEASNYYCTIYTSGKKKHLLTMTLGELEKKLSDKIFIRIHRSHVINLDFVKEFIPHFNGEYVVVMQDGTQLKLSRNYKENLGRLLL
jgi:two-component system LytT family response regulator